MLKTYFGFHVRELYYYDFEKNEMTIGSKTWREGILDKTKNIASGFIASVLWTLSFPDMQLRLKLLKDGDIAVSEENPTWMRCRETVRTEVLSLPPEIYGLPQRRRIIEVKIRLLPRENFIQIYP